MAPSNAPTDRERVAAVLAALPESRPFVHYTRVAAALGKSSAPGLVRLLRHTSGPGSYRGAAVHWNADWLLVAGYVVPGAALASPEQCRAVLGGIERARGRRMTAAYRRRCGALLERYARERPFAGMYRRGGARFGPLFDLLYAQALGGASALDWRALVDQAAMAYGCPEASRRPLVAAFCEEFLRVTQLRALFSGRAFALLDAQPADWGRAARVAAWRQTLERAAPRCGAWHVENLRDGLALWKAARTRTASRKRRGRHTQPLRVA